MIAIINIIDGEVQTTDFYFHFLLKFSWITWKLHAGYVALWHPLYWSTMTQLA